ncbi:GrdB-related putative oxidoreductase [Candidatus Clostridium stratigraminis]|uniref:GrdB-related putative oxidoreductase n=1 Tax=Candidatus Clostridium stratigraminis TaxID=3381661 RepID=A0ABW8T0W8_9CLOT
MPIKIMMIYDQIQAGAGTKDDKMVPLGAKREPVGPAIMMEPFLKEIDGKVIACLYCGNGTYLADPEEVSRKLCAMVNKVQPDVVMCGPALNYKDYANMAAKVAYDINRSTNVPALAAMSVENEETIASFKDKVNIVVTPKKGGIGLNDSLKNMCKLAKALVNKEDVTALTGSICF